MNSNFNLFETYAHDAASAGIFIRPYDTITPPTSSYHGYTDFSAPYGNNHRQSVAGQMGGPVIAPAQNALECVNPSGNMTSAVPGAYYPGTNQQYNMQAVEYFRCTHVNCEKLFRRKCDLRKHEISHNRSFYCWCGKGFSYEKDLNRHQNSVHRGELRALASTVSSYGEPLQGPSLFRCYDTQCDYYFRGFPRKDNYERHVRNKHKIAGFRASQ